MLLLPSSLETFPLFYISERFTWKKGLEENSWIIKSWVSLLLSSEIQNSDFKSFNFIYCKAIEVTCWKCCLTKLFLNSLYVLRKVFTRERDLSKDAPTTLLKSFSVMGDFLEIFQKLNKNSFQYKKHYRGIFSQAYRWRRYVGDTVWFFLISVTQPQLLKTS